MVMPKRIRALNHIVLGCLLFHDVDLHNSEEHHV